MEYDEMLEGEKLQHKIEHPSTLTMSDTYDVEKLLNFFLKDRLCYVKSFSISSDGEIEFRGKIT